MTNRIDWLVLVAAVSGAIGVMAGARGAHGASGPAAEWLKTGSHYQLIHAVAALAVLALPLGRLAGWLFVAGAAIFSGTLYLMAFGAPVWLGAVTPIGGVALIAGWVVLAVGAVTR